ncbi:tyrosine-type recombinase/integrase [Sphingomonas kyeonggiensis]|uniref:Integrase n=1 Tax=Sphingomonas kyeonggiensis TaxID=1268553 RepID=A0A7W6NVC2_9SPHN|nr:integrase arm-type DNA-binding domain-containing protein [Sphingomonas kyeonggiensis]MBB4096471.1 integrase [Sphingomonas kyeonggiensis]
MSGLTALQVKNARPGRHADGRGLYLVVRDSGSRAWVLRAQVEGKRQDFGLGAADKVSLSQARAKASEFRAKLKSGESVRTAKAAAKTVPTFSETARSCHMAIKGGWANKRHSDSWLASLDRHIFPWIGDRRVDEITSVMVRDALAPIWMKTPETARRALQRIGTVLDYAHIEGWCPHEAALRSVTKGLPKQPADEGHFEAMPYADVPAFYARLQALPETPGRDALMFTIFTAARSGETRHATWPEFDLQAATWSIPPARMKMKKLHVVPLTPPVIELLRRRWRLRSEDHGLAFSTDGLRPLSDMTMTKVLRDFGLEKITVHGFRSSFTDWAAEKTKVPKEVVDKALAHKLIDRVEAAYRRTDFFERRRRLMESWAKYVKGAAKI